MHNQEAECCFKFRYNVSHQSLESFHNSESHWPFMSYLLICNKILHNSADEKTKHYFTYVYESGIQEWLSVMVLAPETASTCCRGHQVSGARESAPKLMHLGVGRPWFSQGCWNVVLMGLSTELPACSKHKATGFPQRQEGDPSDQSGREREREPKSKTAGSFIINFRSDMPSLLLHAIGHWDQSWHKVGGDYTRVWISLGGDH